MDDMEKDCFFGSWCQSDYECQPCGLICDLIPGVGKQCTTNPGGGPVGDA